MRQTIRGSSFLLLIAWVLFAGQFASAQAKDGLPDASTLQKRMQEILGLKADEQIEVANVEDTSGLGEAVAKAAVWDNYWFRFWEDKLPKLIQTKASLTAWSVRVVKTNDILIFVDELNSVFDCVRDSGFSCEAIWEFDGPDAAEYQIDKRRYGVGHQKLAMDLNPGLLRVATFGPFDQAKVSKLQRVFQDSVLNAEFFNEVKEYRSPALANRPIRIRVGNFNLDSQWLYYYVEGERYLETIEFDSSGTRVVHQDDGNLDSPPFKWTYPKAVKRIRENGVWFVVKDGKLVRE
jgi:hypothetical protein